MAGCRPPLAARHIDPAVGLAYLQRLEAAFVIHLGVVFDPEAQVDPRYAATTRQLYLLQDRKRTQAAFLFVGIVERIDGRNAGGARALGDSAIGGG